MSGITIGLNNTTSGNRIRFESLSERLKNVNVDIIHRVRAEGSLKDVSNVAPETGNMGCFFQDELEQLKRLETSKQFWR